MNSKTTNHGRFAPDLSVSYLRQQQTSNKTAATPLVHKALLLQQLIFINQRISERAVNATPSFLGSRRFEGRPPPQLSVCRGRLVSHYRHLNQVIVEHLGDSVSFKQ